ncbi:DUF2795 domain-containing protein [Nonomuraea sp. C10]|uniref:DUF2795 domain-containing protein n=1 Tax=Nonomuraea sp. C10 TaxID=2600577 RepID=UPI0011CE6552|nr:DUF2795 domain-containing protein [Nonomuraea sp. C10]TXK34354.1 DUF2795 domain-containing protein [Nonomuraea sp. C10]
MEQQRGSDKHSPRMDEEQKHDSRSEEHQRPEPTGDAPGEERLSAPRAQEPGSPEGMTAEEVDSRSNLARWVSGVHAFPADKKELVERAQEQFAPDAVLSALRSLPDRSYENMNEVAEQLGIAGRGRFD